MNHPIKSWPADRVERKSVASLVPYANNARMHSDAQIAQVARSIEQYGFTVPVLIDDSGGIIAGHCRVLAAKQLGLAEVPTMTATGWSEAERRAYIIIDNKLALNAEWNDAALRVEFADLEATGFDLANLGFDPTELRKVQKAGGGTVGLTDPDEVPALGKTTIQPGEIWQLGNHRILCGDSTEQSQVKALVDGTAVDLILTDPPYCSGGFQESGKSAKSAGSVGTDAVHVHVLNDRLSTRGFQALLKTAFLNFETDFLYSFVDWRMWIWLFDLAESSGFRVNSMIVWDKGRPGMGRMWTRQHELILWACKKTPPFNQGHDKPHANVLQVNRTGNIHHTTEKPVDILKQLLETTPFAQTVADPFAGSGSTIIACEALGRKCFAVELDPGYVQVCIERWENFTGKKAQRAEGFEWNGMWRKPFDRPELVHGPETLHTD